MKNSNIKKTTLMIAFIVTLALTMQMLCVFANKISKSNAAGDSSEYMDENSDYFEGYFKSTGTLSTGMKNAGSNDATLSMGRGLDLTRFGKFFTPNSVVTNQVDKVLDVEHNPCLSYNVQRGARQWSEITWADTTRQWGQKWGVGIEAKFDANSGGGKPGKSLDDVKNAYTIQNGGQTQFIPEWAASKMSSSPAAAGGSISTSYGNESKWTTRQRHFTGATTNVVFNTQIAYSDGKVPSSDGATCEDAPGISQNQLLSALTTNTFKNDVLQKIPAEEFLRKWGNFVLENGGFGAKSGVNYVFNSKNIAKSENVNASASGTYKGFTGSGSANWSNDRSVLADNGQFSTTNFGGYKGPAWNIDGSNPESNMKIMQDWFEQTSTSAIDKAAFVGSPVQFDSDIKQFAAQQLYTMGKFIWEYVDSKMLAPDNVRYPDADACNAKYGPLGTDGKDQLDACLSIAGKVMTYQDYLQITYRRLLIERGSSLSDELPPPPYVKDIYFGHGPKCALGSFGYCMRPARDDLKANMNSVCDVTNKCLMFSVKDHQSLNAGSKIDGVNARAILFGYTLTNNPNEALVNFDVGIYNYATAAKTDCISILEIPRYPTENKFCPDNQRNFEMNDGAGGKWIYLTKLMRYNSDMESGVDENGNYYNSPITAIGLENQTHNEMWPNKDDTSLPEKGESKPNDSIVNGELLSTGAATKSNSTIWQRIPQDLNAGAGGDYLYFWVGH